MLVFGNNILDITSKLQATKPKINKRGEEHQKVSAQQRKRSTRWKSTLENGRKCLKNHTADKVLLSKTYKELIQLKREKGKLSN